ncbi:MAG: Mov34/MPN/PAD-1 family protein [Candidatus Thermoplasmatota archaeon]
MILEMGKSSMPNEFGALLKVRPGDKHTIAEIAMLPGTIAGTSHALFQLHMLPVDYSIVGTVHSHPSGDAFPSEDDMFLFSRYGRIHVIVASPFTEDSWNVFDHTGKTIDVELVA